MGDQRCRVGGDASGSGGVPFNAAISLTFAFCHHLRWLRRFLRSLDGIDRWVIGFLCGATSQRFFLLQLLATHYQSFQWVKMWARPLFALHLQHGDACGRPVVRTRLLLIGRKGLSSNRSVATSCGATISPRPVASPSVMLMQSREALLHPAVCWFVRNRAVKATSILRIVWRRPTQSGRLQPGGSALLFDFSFCF